MKNPYSIVKNLQSRSTAPLTTAQEIRLSLIAATLITVSSCGVYYGGIALAIIDSVMISGIGVKIASVFLILLPVFFLTFIGFLWVKFTKGQYDRVRKLLKTYWIILSVLALIFFVLLPVLAGILILLMNVF